jgi:tetratricopeptide (TPR) repeat protein/predicted Ser/Thr protein kinase
MPSDRGSAPGADASRRIGRYELIERIGRGGMGEVFLARDTQLGRTVAIKALAADHVPAHSDRERFRQEVANLVAVTHPYVAAVYDVVEDGDDLYIVMEHVRGRSLKEAAEADHRPRTIARWGQQVAEALAGIHAAGIVHRDLKPSNVMISESGHVKVLDFGIAKRFTAQLDRDDGTIDTVEDLTRRGVAVGTPNYMSPEQLRLERLDPRSDLFSLGILLYEALTGVHPFRRATPVDTQAAILAGTPGDGVEPPGLAQAGPLREVVLRLLAKGRDQRLADAREAAAALESALSEYTATGTGEGPARQLPWWRRPAAIAGLALAAIAAAALGAVALRGGGAGGSSGPVLAVDQQRLIDRARALRREHRYREALEVLETELKRDPKLLEFEILQATTLMRAGNERRAREVIDHAQWMAREQGLDPRGRLGLEIERGRAEILGRGAEGVTATEVLAKRFPETPGIQVDYAVALADQERTDEALATLDRHLLTDPLDANAWLAKGRILARAARRPEADAAFDEAERAFRSLAVPTGAAAVETERGVVAFEVDGKPAEALKHFRQATALYRAGGQRSLEALSRFQEAGAQLMLGETDQALAGFVEAQQSAAEHGDLSLAAVAQNAHAVSLIRAGRPAEAVPLLRATIDQATLLGDFSLSLSAQGNLVAVLMITGAYDDARRAATETLALAQQRGDDLGYGLTMSLALAQADLEPGKGEAALAELRRLGTAQEAPMGSDAGRAELAAAVGAALLTLERYDDALQPLDEAVGGWTAAGDTDQLGYALVFRAQGRALRGEAAAARADLAAAAVSAGAGNVGVARTAAWVEALVLAGEERAAAALALLEPLRRQTAASGERPLAVDAAILESTVRRESGDAAAALRVARDAEREAAFSESRRIRARAAEVEALLALGRHEEARSMAVDVAAAAGRIGLAVTAERMRALAARPSAAHRGRITSWTRRTGDIPG